MKHSMWIIGLLLVLACPVHGKVVITEVLYDIPGADNSLEWVELLNTGPDPVSLGGYKLGWGGADYSYGEFNLDDIILDVCAVYVVGGPISNESNGNPIFDSPRLFDPNIQNSGSIADGVALFSFSDPFCPVDAVIYGSSNDNNLVDETCMTGSIDVGDAPSGSSIELSQLDGIWNIQENPSPNHRRPCQLHQPYRKVFVETQVFDRPMVFAVRLRCSDSPTCSGLNLRHLVFPLAKG